jgi:tRNA(His) guanylyltransferase
MPDALGDRIKRYEHVTDYHLTPRSPVFIRVDGKSFHTYTRHLEKPFDLRLVGAMVHATQQTARQMTGFKLAYTQSDEASFLITDYDNLDSQGWFDYELSKIISVTASAFTAYFNQAMAETTVMSGPAMFDARAFVVPESDVANVFLWRQKDWARNSIQMLARAHFSHKELLGKKHAEIHEMLFTKGVNWAHLDDQLKNGTYVTRGGALRAEIQPSYPGVEALLMEQFQPPAEDEAIVGA